jgi:hypothetical protein
MVAMMTNPMPEQETAQYCHIDYEPNNGWVLSIMSRLAQSSNARLRQAHEEWHQTPLLDLGFAITTKIQMLTLCIRRLNKRVITLRTTLNDQEEQFRDCMQTGRAFTLPDTDLAYELLLDMDSFIFESRSLYEIVGKFMCNFLASALGKKVTENEFEAILSARNIETRWIDTLRESRKLFFHQTAPWLAISVSPISKQIYPILLKRNVVKEIKDPADFVSFESLQEIYEGFVNTLGSLHQLVMEEIRQSEGRP